MSANETMAAATRNGAVSADGASLASGGRELQSQAPLERSVS
jgi:hypothetical protein